MPDGQPWAGRRLHFVGIGGAGMSGIALVARQLGAVVSGSDRSAGAYTAALQSHGIVASIGHAEENLPPDPQTEVVYSTAVAAENPERTAARRRGLVERHRADLLGEMTALRPTIAVTGTHGKTTTASMVVHALRGAGEDPAFVIGAEVPLADGPRTNARWSAGRWLVVEADESDRSLLELHPQIAVLTNAELDHHGTYASQAELEDTFRRFLGLAAEAVVWDRPALLALRDGPIVPYDAPGAELDHGGSRFRWRDREVRLAVPGAHNAVNAAGALEACRLAGADCDRAVAALAGFHGAARRFEHLGRTPAGASVYDDYAHHPTEVAATLDGARSLAPRRLVAVFQPHLYSRTRLLAREFGEALARADLAVVLDVYPARERAEDHPGVSGLLIAQAAAEAAGGRSVAWLPSFDQAERFLEHELRARDLCVVMGAGDVDGLARRLVRR
jgi:UDP-N-acetylmuramate--alanine ligase